MAKPRKSKRQLIRDEKRKKRHHQELETAEETQIAKRQRREDRQDQGHDEDGTAEYISLEDGEGTGWAGNSGPKIDREFFGMLADQEQEYFRRADELLELNDFPTPEDRDIFLQNVYKEAEGKELKLASSQSCSRLMERLILLSNVRQKKSLFEAFTGHFVTLVTHRFASHCCEQLFIQSAAVVTRELESWGRSEGGDDGDESGDKPQRSMEELFLLALDEFEPHLNYLLSDRFASHTLRVVLVVLSGRPLQQASTRSLLQSKKKEHITVAGAAAATSELGAHVRAVPESFTMAIQKIIQDTTATMETTALRVLATHPTGNPVLQLLLELDISLNKGSKTSTLLEKLIPGAPQSLSDASSPATDFINSMVYDSIGSRLLETLVVHCPGKVFKALYANIFGPRIDAFLRNDIACYPAMKVVERLSQEDLVAAVDKALSVVPTLVEKGRFNVLKTLFERCDVRGARKQTDALLGVLCDSLGCDHEGLIPKLCGLDGEEESAEKESQQQQQAAKSKAVLASHGSHLVTSLLSISGTPSKAIQASLLSLTPDQLMRLATTSRPTASVLITALQSPSQSPIFHKLLVAALSPRVMDLASSQFGHNVLNTVITTPSRGNGIAVPFHLKEALITQLTNHEADLRESWTGRSVWQTWKGDLWRHRRTDWIKWAKEVDPEEARAAATPKPRKEKLDDRRQERSSSFAKAQRGVGIKA